jgi:hypothetical protein
MSVREAVRDRDEEKVIVLVLLARDAEAVTVTLLVSDSEAENRSEKVLDREGECIVRDADSRSEEDHVGSADADCEVEAEKSTVTDLLAETEADQGFEKLTVSVSLTDVVKDSEAAVDTLSDAVYVKVPVCDVDDTMVWLSLPEIESVAEFDLVLVRESVAEDDNE